MRVGEVLLEVVRNDLVESIHAGHLVIIDQDGNSILKVGDLDSPIYPRSAIKAIQAAAMVRAGLKLAPKELALVCASHAGSQEHLDTAKAILKGVGLDERSLQNTPDRPLGNEERFAWGDKPASSLAANCSGKHSGMLATCVTNGWDISNYLDAKHPLQRLIAEEIETLSAELIAKVAVDGCGAPLFGLSLSGVARAFANLVRSPDPIHSEVVKACTSNPEMVSGKGRLPTILMEEVPNLFVKDGAEGVMVMAHQSYGVIAWKMSDGSQRGAGVLASATLSHLGIKTRLEPEYVRGGGQVVGEIRASRILANE